MPANSVLYLTRAQSRAVDEIAIRDFGISGLVLMENAGRSCAEFIHRYLCSHPEKKDWPVVICCGKGNNGGDGFVIARTLANWGIEPTVLLWATTDEISGDAAVNCAILEKMGAKIVPLTDSKWDGVISSVQPGKAIIVDALLGTGAQGEPRPPYDHAITWINSLGAIVFAIDLPSGLDADSGKPSENTIRASHTLTFVAYKAGFATAGSWTYLGAVHVMDIGVPRAVIDAALKR